MDDDLRITPKLRLAAWELSERFIRASGPGGQNVNKVSSAVQLRWNLEASALPADVKARFRRRYRARLTQEGDIIIEARQHRHQAQNRAEARTRLAGMIREVAEPPKPRKPTRPTQGSVRRRLKAKKVRGEVKALRGRIESDD
jgi:ribosome-associated protein